MNQLEINTIVSGKHILSISPGYIILTKDNWLTIGDAPSFMISEKLARQLREYVDGIEERQVNGGGTNAK